jgi:hypothetical protein
MFDSDGGDNEWNCLVRRRMFSVLPQVIFYFGGGGATAPSGPWPPHSRSF